MSQLVGLNFSFRKSAYVPLFLLKNKITLKIWTENVHDCFLLLAIFCYINLVGLNFSFS